MAQANGFTPRPKGKQPPRELDSLPEAIVMDHDTTFPPIIVEPPILPDPTNNPAANDPAFFKTPRKLERKQWLGGRHSSYRWAA